MKSNVVYSSIAANPSKFPSIFPILTLSLDFPISIVIFCFLKNICPKRKEKRKSCARFNSQSRFSKFDMGIFVAHAYSVALLVGEMSRCRCQQTLKIPVTSHKKKERKNKASSVPCKDFHSSVSPSMQTIRHSVKSAYAISTYCFARAGMG